jgi:hypothetical protein
MPIGYPGLGGLLPGAGSAGGGPGARSRGPSHRARQRGPAAGPDMDQILSRTYVVPFAGPCPLEDQGNLRFSQPSSPPSATRAGTGGGPRGHPEVPAPSVRKPTVRDPLDRHSGEAGPPGGAESVACPKTLRKIMASMRNRAQCSPTSRRIVRNESGSDPGGQQGAKYRVIGPSKG